MEDEEEEEAGGEGFVVQCWVEVGFSFCTALAISPKIGLGLQLVRRRGG